jgi:uncharacterized protein
MRRLSRTIPIFLAFVTFAPPIAAQQDAKALLQANAVVEQKLMVPMRDGVRLATDVYRPKGDQPVPVIFSRTPYNFNTWRDGEESMGTYAAAWEAVRRGYAYVVQNERGRFFSEGDWEILGAPRTDGYDAIEWLATQSWSSGKVGLIGCSSTAEWQMGVAALTPPGLAAVVPQGYGAGVGRVDSWYEQGNWYRGGAVQLLFTAWLYGNQNNQRPMFPPDIPREDMIRLSRYFDLAPEMPRVDWAANLRHLPLADIMRNVEGPRGIFDELIRRTPDDAGWYDGGLYHDDMPFNTPGLWFMSWYDVSTGPNLALYNHVRANAKDPAVRDAQYAVIAPTLHCAYRRATEETIVGERNLGDARFDYDELIYGWFDHWLKGEPADILARTPKVQYYTMGLNRWQAADTWPPADAELVTYYLDSTIGANSLFGDGRLTTTAPATEAGRDVFTYDPMNPVPSLGGNVCCTGNAVTGGAFDQRVNEARNDVLVYTTEPFRDGVEVTGTIEIQLYVSSDARDTDFTVKLIDVDPEGRAYNLDETIQRVRYREGYNRVAFMEEGEVYRVQLSPLSTSNWFAPGHRIRIEVSSSNFPRFDRNLNTGGNNWDEARGVVAHNIVHHSARYPSSIRLPFVRQH